MAVLSAMGIQKIFSLKTNVLPSNGENIQLIEVLHQQHEPVYTGGGGGSFSDLLHVATEVGLSVELFSVLLQKKIWLIVSFTVVPCKGCRSLIISI